MKNIAVNHGLKVLEKLHSKSVPVAKYETIDYQGGGFNGIELLIGTGTGLYHYSDNKLAKLFSGRVYGITRSGMRWYIVINQRVALGTKLVSSLGYMVSFDLVSGRCENVCIKYFPLDVNVHQIDYWNGSIYVAETSFNRILKIKKGATKGNVPRDFYIAGKLTNGRLSQN